MFIRALLERKFTGTPTAAAAAPVAASTPKAAPAAALKGDLIPENKLKNSFWTLTMHLFYAKPHRVSTELCVIRI